MISGPWNASDRSGSPRPDPRLYETPLVHRASSYTDPYDVVASSASPRTSRHQSATTPYVMTRTASPQLSFEQFQFSPRASSSALPRASSPVTVFRPGPHASDPTVHRSPSSPLLFGHPHMSVLGETTLTRPPSSFRSAAYLPSSAPTLSLAPPPATTALLRSRSAGAEYVLRSPSPTPMGASPGPPTPRLLSRTASSPRAVSPEIRSASPRLVEAAPPPALPLSRSHPYFVGMAPNPIIAPQFPHSSLTVASPSPAFYAPSVAPPPHPPHASSPRPDSYVYRDARSLSGTSSDAPLHNRRHSNFFMDPIEEAYRDAELRVPRGQEAPAAVPLSDWARRRHQHANETAAGANTGSVTSAPTPSQPANHQRQRPKTAPAQHNPAARSALKKERPGESQPDPGPKPPSNSRPLAPPRQTAASIARGKQTASNAKQAGALKTQPALGQQAKLKLSTLSWASDTHGGTDSPVSGSPRLSGKATPMASVFLEKKGHPMASVFKKAAAIAGRTKSKSEFSPRETEAPSLKEELTQIKQRGPRQLAQHIHHKLKQPEGAREALTILDLTHTSDMPFLRAFGELCRAENGPPKVYQMLFDYVRSSERSPGNGKCAANAISMLNAANVPFAGMDFRNINIPRAILRSADFSYANLSGANLQGGDLKGAILDQADFSGANLTDVTATELLKTLEGDGSGVTCVAVSDDGKVLVSASENGAMNIWDEGTGSLQHRIRHPGKVTSLAITANGRQIVSGSSDHCVRTWSTATGIMSAEFAGHTGLVTGVAINAHGSFVASGSEDGTVRIWKDALLHTLQSHTGAVRCIAMSGTGGFVASGGADGAICIWDAFAGTLLKTFTEHAGPIKSVALNGEATLLVSSAEDKTLRIWNPLTGEQTKSIDVFDGDCDHVVVSRDGHCIVSTSVSCAAQMWLPNGTPTHTFEGHTGTVRGLAVSGSGGVVVSCSADGTVRVWNGDTGEVVKASKGLPGEILSVRASSNGEFIVSGSTDHTVRVWSPHAAKLLQVLEGHTGNVWSVATSTTANIIVSGSDDKTVRVWKYPLGICTAVFTGHTRRVFSVDVSGDGLYAVSGSEDQSVKLWDVEAGTLLKSLYSHSRWVVSVAISANGEIAVSGSDDHKICVWSRHQGQLEETLKGHTASVVALAISSDGGTIVSGSKDGTACIWGRDRGTPLQVLKSPTAEAEGVGREVFSVAITPDGTLVASGNADHTVRLWTPKSGELLATLEGHSGEVSSVSMPSNGEFVVSGSADRTVRIWRPTAGDKWRSTILRSTNDALLLFAHKMRLSPSTTLSPSLKEILLTSGAVEGLP